MHYSEKYKAAFHLLEHTSITDEIIFKRMAIYIIDKLSMDELAKLFRIEKTDPRTEENVRLIKDPRIISNKKHHIMMLDDMQIVEYDIRCEI